MIIGSPKVSGKKVTFTKSKDVSTKLNKDGSVTLKSYKGTKTAQAVYIQLTDASSKAIRLIKAADISANGGVTAVSGAVPITA